MKEKIIGIGVCMLMIVTAILPVAGTIQEPNQTTIAQFDGPTLEWSFVTGGPYRDQLLSVYETEDGGFITSGVTENPKDVYSGWVIKLDNNGHEEWRTIETEIQGYDFYQFGIVDLCQTQDGGYIIAGACARLEDLKYAFLWKITAQGETQWFNSGYSGSNMGEPYVVVFQDIQPVVNGYLVVGKAWYMQQEPPLISDGIMMKVDLNGNPVWRQLYPYGDDDDEIRAVSSTLDGGYIMAGTVNYKLDNIPSQNDSDIWIIKTDAEGNKQWEKTYGGSKDEWVLMRDIHQTSDGGYLLDAMTESYHANQNKWCIMLQKLDGNGNELWNKTYGESNEMTSSWGLDTTSDGGYIIPATKNHTKPTKPMGDMWLIITDRNGNVEWNQIYGGDKDERCYSAKQVSDGGYILCGITESFTVGGGWDACVVKYSSFANNRPAKPTTPSGSSRGKVDEAYTFSTSSSDSDGDDIYYRWDWGDGNFSDWLSLTQATYAWSYEAQFAVRVMAEDDHGGQSEWSDPLPITMPYSSSNPVPAFLEWLFQRCPSKFPILWSLWGY